MRDLRDVRVGEYRRQLSLVFVAVALLFAIAAANVAGLVLVHLTRRTAEFAVRAALGASRRHIASTVLREMLILAALASAGGLALAIWLTRVAASTLTLLPRAADVRVDGPTLAFVVLIVAAAALVFGLVQPLPSSVPASPLCCRRARARLGRRHRLPNAIVVTQLALGVLTFHVGASWDDDRAPIGQLQGGLLTELPRLPGVREAGLASFLPATGATLRFQVRVIHAMRAD